MERRRETGVIPFQRILTGKHCTGQIGDRAGNWVSGSGSAWHYCAVITVTIIVAAANSEAIGSTGGQTSDNILFCILWKDCDYAPTRVEVQAGGHFNKIIELAARI